MKLSTTWLARVEGIGLILILFSFFVQIFQNNSEESFRNSQNYHINKKLDHIWALIENKYADDHPELNLSPVIKLKSIDKDWELYSRQAKEMETWENKIDLFADISTWIFVLGTILVILPKFIPEKINT
ncbi:MAG: hypothetical protein ACO1N0_10530 [Fluviicola sp.]